MRGVGVLNTWSRLPVRRRYTWKSPGDTRQCQLGYVLVRHRFCNSVKSAAAYPGADFFSDHNLVLMKVKLCLERPRIAKRKRKWNVHELATSDVRTDINREIKPGNRECM